MGGVHSMRRFARRGESLGLPAQAKALVNVVAKARLLAAGMALMAALAAFAGTAWAQPAQAPAGPSTALYYGASPPWTELAAFDQVVLEPGHGFDIARRAAAAPRTRFLAYVSVGEVHPRRPYFDVLPERWRAGHNKAWGSVVIDQRQPDWPHWFVERVARPQWERGYRGFFLDTLDSYQLVAKTAEERAAHEAGLVRVVQALKAAFPQARLVFNRGFEILPQVAEHVDMVAAESLYRGWDPVAGRYREVSADDRAWLLGQLQKVRREWQRPVLAIDYVAPGERALARDTARRIEAHGFVPWVANPALDVLGVGSLEVLPRKLLMLHDTELKTSAELTFLDMHRFIAAPAYHLGLVPEYLDVDRQPLPAGPLAGRVAGIVTRFQNDKPRPALAAWLQRAMADGVKVASLGQPGVGPALQATFGLTRGAAGVAPVEISRRDPIAGFEALPQPSVPEFSALGGPGHEPLLQWRDGQGATMDVAAITPWGGYALPGSGLLRMPGSPETWRWVVDPVAFLRRSLQLPPMPVPDTTTESGRRMLMVHVDGDGFANRSELPGTPLAGDVMLRELVRKYRVPTTISVIEGETSAQGLYPKDAAAMEATARALFALPHVEVASHTYSHPFRWSALERGATGKDYALGLPGYRFDPEREIGGSIRYIEQRLAPPHKKVKLFLWSGDTNPTETTLDVAAAQGIATMNGGETTITRAAPTLTQVGPLGIPKGPHFQVYAPNQNENVYTNLFTGPFYGFERVLETFEMTERPYRLKPIDIYYHTYSASKRASLEALHKVYRSVLAMPLHPVYASEYVARAQSFADLVVARRLAPGGASTDMAPGGASTDVAPGGASTDVTPGGASTDVPPGSGDAPAGYRVRNAGALRELRIPAAAGLPQPSLSQGLAGYSAIHGEHHLHLAADEAELVFGGAADSAPYLVDANGRVERAERSAGAWQLRLNSHVPLSLTLHHAPDCRVSAGGKPLAATRAAGGIHHYSIAHDGTETFSVACR